MNPKKPRKICFCGKACSEIAAIYCSLACSNQARKAKKILDWQCGIAGAGNLGRAVANFVKHYLITKRGEKCEVCGWCQKNVKTGKTPIEVDHIDGDYTNNSEFNLRLLCPNCHSLTATYKGLNRGNGRKSRTYL